MELKLNIEVSSNGVEVFETRTCICTIYMYACTYISTHKNINDAHALLISVGIAVYCVEYHLKLKVNNRTKTVST